MAYWAGVQSPLSVLSLEIRELEWYFSRNERTGRSGRVLVERV